MRQCACVAVLSLGAMQSRTLGSLILSYELVLVLLLLLTGALSWQTTVFWYDNSRELGRINQLLQHNEQIRSALTRQLQFLLQAGFMDDDTAVQSYNKNTKTLDRLFGSSFRLTQEREEDVAIQTLQQQYRMVQVDMNKIRNANRSRSLSSIRMLDPGYATRMTGIFDQYHSEWHELLVSKSEAVTANLERWLKITIMLYLFLLLLAGTLLLLTRRTLRQQFVLPMQALTKGAAVASKGDLQARMPVQGTSETRQLAQALNEMSDQLAHSRDKEIQQGRQVALGALVPVVAHNIRNPLAGIRATVQLFDMQSDASEINEHKKSIIDTVDRLGRWVSSLLSYLHPLQPRHRPCQAARLVQDVTGILRDEGQNQVELRQDRMDHDLVVQADPDLVEQALYCLISNAIDASPDNGLVTLEVFREGEHAVMRILDQGPGMPFAPGHEELVPGRSTKRFGTGLGLPIARKIFSTHGWELRFLDCGREGTEATTGTDVRILAPLYTGDQLEEDEPTP